VLEESEHMKPKTQQPVQLLRRSIRLARRLERIASRLAASKPLTLVGYGFLIRSRRLARAIEAIPPECAYEALILLRTMLEIFFDYRWIHLKRKHSRAVRFLRYQAIDKLKSINAMPTMFTPHQLRSIRARLKTRRSKARHLFRVRDKNGKLRWATSWAYPISSVASRMSEVRLHPGTTPQDNEWYGVYSWMSWVVHASPQSLDAVVTLTGPLRPAKQPIKDPSMPTFVACVLVLSIVGVLANDLKVTKALEPEFSRLKRHLKL